MEWYFIGLLIIGGLLLLLALGVPIAAAMGIIAIVGMAVGPGFRLGLASAGIEAYQFLSSYDLVPLPLFMYMANLLLVSGVGQDMFEIASKWLSRLRGGLAMVTIGACAGFATLSGSSIGAAATMGVVALPEMRKRGYSQRLATGAVGAAGGLAHLIPPSALAVFYAALVSTSAGEQLFAGMGPGIVLAITYAGVVFIWVSLKKGAAPSEARVGWIERLSVLRKAIAPIIIVLSVLGAIYAGIATVTEAAAVGTFASLIVAVYKRVGLRRILDATVDTVINVGFIMLISAGAKTFSWILSYYQVPQSLIILLMDAELNRWILLAAIQILYIIMGMFIDPISMLLITLPVIYPMLAPLGFDPVWFGVLALINIEMAIVTPPFGFNLFIIHGIVPDVPIGDVIKGCMAFVVADIIVLALTAAFPQIALWLPSMMRG